jgi:hypothetical protein
MREPSDAEVEALSEWLDDGEEGGLPRLAALWLLTTAPSDRALRGWQLYPGLFSEEDERTLA